MEVLRAAKADAAFGMLPGMVYPAATRAIRGRGG
jgi:hypothetical protein